jgi:hypothetical protein
MRVPISSIPRDEKSFSISNAVVAYLDILGFSERRSEEDMENCLLDFTGPLTLAVMRYRHLRVNVFSDCAFVAASKSNAVYLLRALRFAFKEWLADSMLVRGGIALGRYTETITSHIATIRTVRESFNCSLFSGSAVSAAVRVEESGNAALLFATRECARYFQSTYSEPVYSLDGMSIIGWFDDPNTLYWFTSISLVRILRLLGLKKGVENRRTMAMLQKNLRYSWAVDPYLSRFVILTILSSPIESSGVRNRVRRSLGIAPPTRFELKAVKEWLRTRQSDFEAMIAIADMDSSITMRNWNSRLVQEER